MSGYGHVFFNFFFIIWFAEEIFLLVKLSCKLELMSEARILRNTIIRVQRRSGTYCYRGPNLNLKERNQQTQFGETLELFGNHSRNPDLWDSYFQ